MQCTPGDPAGYVHIVRVHMLGYTQRCLCMCLLLITTEQRCPPSPNCTSRSTAQPRQRCCQHGHHCLHLRRHRLVILPWSLGAVALCRPDCHLQKVSWSKVTQIRSLGASEGQQPGFSRCPMFPISGFLDMLKLFPGTFQDFNFDILKSHWTCRLYIPRKLRFFSPVSKSPSPVHLCRSCLRRFGSLRKNTPLDIWSMYLAEFVIFNDFRPPKPFAAMSQLPAALWLPQKKRHPWNLGACILWIWSMFSDMCSFLWF